MNTLRRLLVAATLVVGSALLATSPASAAASASESTTAVSTEVVMGEPWSAPAYTVDCTIAQTQINCTPQNPKDVKPQRCFINLPVAQQRTSLCTTYEGHVEAIQAAGGKAVLVEYGCSVGDLVCVTFENAGRGMALSSMAMMSIVAANTRFDTSSVLWSAAVDEWSFWQWAILIVLFGAFVWAIGAAVVTGDRGEIVAAVVRCFVAVVAVPLSLWITGHLLNAIDDMTWYLMERGSAGLVFQQLQAVMFAGGQANYFFAFVIHGMLMLAMLLLMLVFTFRNIVLAALIAVGPIGWMIFPVRGIGPQWVVRYVSSIVVLLLTGPLTIGFVSLIVKGLASVKTIWDPQSWPLLFGLVLVAFAPFAVFGLFSFVGAVAADGLGARMGGNASRMGTDAARSAIRVPSRVGALPAGIASSGRSGATSPAGRIGPGSRAGGASTPSGARPASATSTATRNPPSAATSSTAPNPPSHPQPNPSGSDR